MGDQDKEGREREVRDRIVNLLQATEQARKKQITDEELHQLKTAACRLDQMLRAAADADLEALRTAAARLDQLLAHIGAGAAILQPGLDQYHLKVDWSTLANTLRGWKNPARSQVEPDIFIGQRNPIPEIRLLF